MATKQKIKVLQRNYENISPYKDHIRGADIGTKQQRTFRIQQNKWRSENIIYIPICTRCKCTNSQTQSSYTIKQALLYRRQ